ncbi:leucine-rich repeat-containing DDB_G0281931 [Paramuricea clavata]|uniref:Leucine-rich repeat-containing DDB_G0281931 n=1 Tax=Paramuricea clavata TaxID=317549 RepID=A0A7D9HR53_PARCT|nr:leucine-rich repeat-containing DDB_G0281931 [Paramuricea clavata]
MTGTISDVISSNMNRLRQLCLAFSGIYGEIPWDLILQLHNLEKLQVCCMNETKLHGTIPHYIDRLPKLQVLSVGNNYIKGRLPSRIRNLTKLWFLDLEYAKFKSGEMGYFSNMSQLTYLHLTNCGLRGTIPNDFGKTNPNIYELRLYGNRFEGKINNCFDGFQKITQLILGSNKLNGLLPATLNKLQTLQVLDLSNNNFTGFAANLSFNSQLQILYLDRNIHLKIDGNVLLKSLQPCVYSLRMLVASNCGLKGGLSYSLFNFHQVMYIDLSYNKLTGRLPINEEYNMVYLFYLAVASNNFTGELPMTFFTPLKSLNYLDVRQNRFLKSKGTFPNINMILTYSVKIQKDTFSCPTVRFSNSGGQIEMDPGYYDHLFCSCNKGYYGYRSYCKPCMQGGSCKVKEATITNKTKTLLSSKQNEIKMNMKKGYWPCCGDFDNVTKLVKCSQQEKFDDEICNLSEDCKCWLRLVNVHHLKTTCNSSCVCRHANKGRFCSQCINGYYKKGSLCVRCPEFRKNFPIILLLSFLACFVISITLMICLRRRKKRMIIVLFVFAVALIVLHANSIIPSWFFMLIFAVWILGLSDAGSNLKSFWSIAVFFFQSLDAMLSDAKIWPTKIVLLKYQITNAFNFEFSKLTCSFSAANRPEVTFAVILLLPIAGLSLIWLFHGLAKICCGRNRNISSHRYKRWSLRILLFVYFPITAKTFDAIFPCEHRDGLSYLKNAPWLDCNGISHNWLLILGYLSLVVFVIGIPLLIFGPLLYRYLDSEGQTISQDIDNWMKPLYEEFKPPFRRYFRLVFLSRRLLLAVFLTIVPTTSSYQILSITLLLITFIIITLVFRPYKRYSEKFEFETLADVFVSVVLLLSFVSLAFVRLSTRLDNSLVWLIISMNFVMVLCCFLGIVLLFLMNLWNLSNLQAENVQCEPMLH